MKLSHSQSICSLLFFVLTLTVQWIEAQERPGANTAIISLFFRPLTPRLEKECAQRELKALFGEKPTEQEVKLKLDEDAQSAVRLSEIPFLEGIYVSYQGMVATSDCNGQVVFANRQAQPKLTVVVTDSLTPIIIFSNTVQHMNVREEHEAIFYEVTRTRDPKLKRIVWNTTLIPSPTNRRIPDDALIIFAKPSQVVIMEGKTITTEDVNLLLPTVYIRTGITSTDNALQFMKVAKFYAPVEKINSYASDRYATMLIR